MERYRLCQGKLHEHDEGEWMNAEEVLDIIDKLPRTADGMPVVPGMELFIPTASGVALVYAREFFQHKHPNKITEWHVSFAWGSLDIAKSCYSTREAAEAAEVSKKTNET